MKKLNITKSIKRLLTGTGILAIIIIAGFFFINSYTLATGKTLADSEAPQIAFLADKELYVYDYATGKFIKLTRTKNRVWGAAWSPDGRYLAFDYNRPNENPAIYRLDVTSGELLRLTPAGGLGCGFPTWSPDGTSIACSTIKRPGNGEILLIQADGTDITSLAEGSHPSWSSDSTHLLYILDQDPTDSYNPGIASIDIRDGTVTLLLDLDKASQDPKWSPDGTKIAFLENLYDPTWGGLRDFTLKMWDGHSITVISEDISRSSNHFEWSPDGTAIQFMGCKYDLASAETTCPLLSIYNAYSPDWSQIAYFDGESGKVCLIPMDTDCVKVPKAWRPGFVWVIDWRPQAP